MEGNRAVIATPGAGQTIIKQEGAGTELKQVLSMGKWGILAAGGVVAAFVAEAIMIGPIVGLWFGLAVIVWVFSAIMRRAIAARLSYLAQSAIAVVFVAALVTWAAVGYDQVAAHWIPYNLAWPAWVEVPLDVVLWAVRFYLGWVAWRLWSEIVDPHGPTSPRAAIVRDKTIPPWAPETFGGLRAAPATQAPAPAPASEGIEVPPVVVMDSEGRRRAAGVPPLAAQLGAWKLATYLRAVVNGVRAFSRRGATAGGLFTRGEWHALEAWTIGQGFHERGSGSLNDAGIDWAEQTIGRLVPLYSTPPHRAPAGGRADPGGPGGPGRAGPGEGS